MISTVPSVSSVLVELDDRLSSTVGRIDETTKVASIGVIGLLSSSKYSDYVSERIC
jgi:hypothetical protein